ncbi:hypothetical protein ACJX0J_005670, partial [Zea mays]
NVYNVVEWMKCVYYDVEYELMKYVYDVYGLHVFDKLPQFIDQATNFYLFIVNLTNMFQSLIFSAYFWELFLGQAKMVENKLFLAGNVYLHVLFALSDYFV